MEQDMEHGGEVVGSTLAERGISELFTLCGGHISPILVGAKRHGIDVVDVRDEASAVFAADATARLTGIPGAAAVTAGPGVTNTITAVKNAQLAKSPVLIFGGAAATLLQGRGALQDIDQMSLMESATKWCTRVTQVKSLAPTVDKALEVATEGVPGPVFIEIPIDLLYPEQMVRDWYMDQSGVKKMKGMAQKAFQLYLKGHLAKLFQAPHFDFNVELYNLANAFPVSSDAPGRLDDAATAVSRADRPVLIIGSQAVSNKSKQEAEQLADAVRSLGIPTYLGGMARGLLGRDCDIQYFHKRTATLQASDLTIVAGFPFDFRLGYGQKINSEATVVAANLSESELHQNREPEIPLHMHPGEFIERLASYAETNPSPSESWFEAIDEREKQREANLEQRASGDNKLVNPIFFFKQMEQVIDDDSVLIVDGGDFVATGSYVLRPRGPLSWLDPGVFGTLGVGGGFALGAALSRPDSEIWLVYGDGSCGYSIAEFDTCVRHGLAPIAVIGTDASWAQIAREQVEILEDDLATVLRRTEYHTVAEGYGAKGILVTDESKVEEALRKAKEYAADGDPVVVNVHLAESDFRKGSISM